MNNCKLLLAIVVLTINFTFSSSAQHLLTTSGKVIVNQNQDTILLRGMGLGGWMVQEGYMLQTAGFANPQHEIREKITELIGEADTELFYEAWLENHCRKADIDSLKSWGFNSVRLPMHYNLYTLPIEEEPVAGENTWLTKGFEMTDSLIEWCKANEMYVILDLHAAPGGQGMDAGISDYDSEKPSLWESDANKSKMVELWRMLAERYADEEWVAGYDILNEPNWNLPGGVAMRNLYGDVTDAIRSVDTDHIIFIEGNWFANDFTGLTPPWDDNMVYSPHKYWSTNDQGSIQWVLDMRNQYNVPLYLGESGENSNVWFRDAIKLLEDNNIGWAWWPMKKIESIAGPLSVTKTSAYQTLLDYWNGNGSQPSATFAKNTLMEITELLKVENCTYQKDVIDAMFRQVQSDETVPFKTANIPGLVLATNYDMGILGEAYYDIESANYHVSTSTYTAWNNGWIYRNDGVDIEPCSDNVNTNGFNVGWLDVGEWMQYDIDVANTAVYDIEVRIATPSTGGFFNFSVDGADLTGDYYVPVTGGWQNWQTLTIPNVILNEDDEKLRFQVGTGGYNLSSFNFVEVGPTTMIPVEFVGGTTLDPTNIQISLNKDIQDAFPSGADNFEVFVDGNAVPVLNLFASTTNPRNISFLLDYDLSSNEEIRVSYTGTEIIAADNTVLEMFTMEPIDNNLSFVHPIPGRIQAEDYLTQEGVQLENTTDTGGGQNIGFLDPGDYLDYEINVTSTSTYQARFRVASQNTGAATFQLVDVNGMTTDVLTTNFPATGGWQSWITTQNVSLDLPAGRHTLRMLITQSPFNVNWFEFSYPTSTAELESGSLTSVDLFPNPSSDEFNLQAKIENSQDAQIEIHTLNGKIIRSKSLSDIQEINEHFSLGKLPSGMYLISIRLEDGTYYSDKLIRL